MAHLGTAHRRHAYRLTSRGRSMCVCGGWWRRTIGGPVDRVTERLEFQAHVARAREQERRAYRAGLGAS